MKLLPPDHPRNGFDRVLFLMAIAVFVIIQLGCEEWLSKAKGEASKLNCKSDARLVNGELDYGVTVSVTIKNIGEAGVIKITPMVSTSEGNLERDQTLHFDAKESKDLSFFFAEPTINATGVQCRLKVYPKADK